MAAGNSANDWPVFLSGLGRSGTTLCGEILNAHSELAIAEETWFMTAVATRLQNFGFSEERRLEIERAVVRLVYEAYAASQGKPRYGDKVLGNIDGVERLFEGAARYVWMVRHPVDVAESWAERFSPEHTVAILTGVPMWAVSPRGPKSDGPPGDPYLQRRTVLEAVARSAGYLRAVLEQRGLGERILVCPYEDLVSKPAETCARLCEFVGVAYEEQMIDGEHFAARGVRRGDVLNFRKVIDDSSVARWKKLSEEQLEIYAASLSTEVRAALDALGDVGVHYSWDEPSGSRATA
jgi:hypothetical protein